MAASARDRSQQGPVAVAATWPFGKPAVDEAFALLLEGRRGVDALEKGLNQVELDPATGPYFVGRGGLPNLEGDVQLDAAIMRGSDCALGAVAGMKITPRAISVARCVMEKSRHSMIVGDGADKFAEENGFHQEQVSTPASEEAFRNYQASRAAESVVSPGASRSSKTDTLSAIALDGAGTLTAAVTTSGMAFKAVGRVGDSPIVGAGLYADADAGAAVATGDGDNIMKYCPAIRIVDAMSAGKSPDQACSDVISSIAKRRRRAGQPMFEMAVIAMAPDGAIGAGSTFSHWEDHVTGQKWSGFPYAVAHKQGPSATPCVEMRVCGAAGDFSSDSSVSAFPVSSSSASTATKSS